MRFFNWISQVAAVTMLNLRTLPQRRGAALSTVVGVAGVVMVFVAVLSIAEGFRATLSSSGSPDTAMVLRGGSDSEMVSGIPRDAARIIADAPGVLRTAAGPVASNELYVIVDVPKRSTGTSANVPQRGVTAAAFEVRKALHLVAGRLFQPGRNEVIVGRGAAAEFAGLEVGKTLVSGQNRWQVVGMFTTGGQISDSEIWCDVDVLMPIYRRTMFQSVHVKLASADGFAAFKNALTADPRLDVKVEREADYYAEQSRALTSIVTFLGVLIAGLMAVGAVFGSLLTMYSAVATRVREIATLRALGFGGLPVVASVISESLLLSLLGGVLGGAVAYFVFNGYQAATINWQTFSQVAFAFAVTPRLLGWAILATLVMGFVGGIFPAVRAARIPVASALREV
ncbi:MAG TPA: ABC transporter permease [Thermoanaerobaculia bacterium]|nr:ABC transporter permease [Thermoanaerobaculia bacterium]